MKTINGVSPAVSATWIWITLIVFVLVYVVFAVVDGVLMIRYGAQEPGARAKMTRGGADRRRRRAGGRRAPGPDLLGGRRGLADLWFIIIAFFWTGFFILEGFDLGVGVLHSVVGKTDLERRVAINSIGPFWDGNEVWLIVAGAGIFAAFPGLVRHHVLRPVPGAHAGDPGAHRPGRVLRVPGQVDDPPVAGRLDWTSPSAASCSRCCSASALGDLLAGLPINSERRLHRLLLRPAHRLRRVGRRDPAGLAAARRHVPQPQDHGRGAGRARGSPDRSPGSRCPPCSASPSGPTSDPAVAYLPGPPFEVSAFLLVVAAASGMSDHAGWGFTATTAAIAATSAIFVPSTRTSWSRAPTAPTT